MHDGLVSKNRFGYRCLCSDHLFNQASDGSNGTDHIPRLYFELTSDAVTIVFFNEKCCLEHTFLPGSVVSREGPHPTVCVPCAIPPEKLALYSRQTLPWMWGLTHSPSTLRGKLSSFPERNFSRATLTRGVGNRAEILSYPPSLQLSSYHTPNQPQPTPGPPQIGQTTKQPLGKETVALTSYIASQRAILA